jgi:hypothetical protein
MTRRRLCIVALGLAAAETLFWLYTFYHIDRHANPRGDGLEIMAAVPMTLIFVIGVLPGLIFSLLGLRYSLAAAIAVICVGGAAIADAVIWTQILQEFARH